MIELSPAILTDDISDFRKKYSELLAFTDYFKKLHVDFSDGKFVNNTTIKPRELFFLSAHGGSAMSGKSPFILVGHFMTFSPQRYFWDAKLSGFKFVLVHYEAFMNDVECEHAIEHGRSMNLKVGLVLNPETPLHKIAKFLPSKSGLDENRTSVKKPDLIQLMGIHPGFQGREFIPQTIERIKELRALSKNIVIAVDGGVRVGIAKQIADAGANMIVAGSAIVKADDEAAAIEALREDIES